MACLRIRIAVLCGLSALALVGCATGGGLPQAPRVTAHTAPEPRQAAFPESMFTTRSVRGLQLSLWPSGAVGGVGRMRFIGGVDTNPDRSVLVGGMLWRKSLAAGGNLRLGLVNSASDRVQGIRSSTLLLGSIDLAPGTPAPWPQLTFQGALMPGYGSRTVGLAGGLRLRGRLAGLHYHGRVMRTGRAFRPLGASLAPGRLVRAIGLRYSLAGWFQARAHSLACTSRIPGSTLAVRRHELVLSRTTPDLGQGLDKLRLDVSYHRRRAAGLQRSWRVALNGAGLRLQSWQLATGVIWEQHLRPQWPVARYTWLVQGRRPVHWAQFDGMVSSNLAFRRANGRHDRWGLSAALGVRSGAGAGGWSVQLEYSGLGPVDRGTDDAGPVVMLRVSLNGAGVGPTEP